MEVTNLEDIGCIGAVVFGFIAIALFFLALMEESN